METARPPILIHCRSGKDRTGVIVAAVLKLLGYPDEAILEEYHLSQGLERPSAALPSLLQSTLNGFRDRKQRWCRGVDVVQLGKNLCGQLGLVEQDVGGGGQELAYLTRRAQYLHGATKTMQEQAHTQQLCKAMLDVCQAIMTFNFNTNSLGPRLRALMWRGWALERLERWEEAHATYDQALSLCVEETAASGDQQETRHKFLTQRRAACKCAIIG